MGESTITEADFFECGRDSSGQPRQLDRRLFMRLTVYQGIDSIPSVVKSFGDHGLNVVLYQNVHDPSSLGVLSYTENPDEWIGSSAHTKIARIFSRAQINSNFNMLGRTYALGYEADLEHYLLKKPIERVNHPDNSWAIWYPLRRQGAFEQLAWEEQKKILMEHGQIGIQTGQLGFAQDVRLAAHGLNEKDHDFIIGLLGQDLAHLSKLVHRMRKTIQTAQYIEHMGPFFVGKAIWQGGKT